MSNPYSTAKPWTPEILAAYQAMPKDAKGHNFHLYPAAPDYLKKQWREWCR